MPLSFEDAQDLARSSCIGPGEVMKLLGVAYSDAQLARFREVPFSLETLRRSQETHLLLPGYPIDLMGLSDKFPKLFLQTGSYRESFPRADVEPRWYLIRTTPKADSLLKPFTEQRPLMSVHEYVPLACEIAFMAVLQFLRKGERLFGSTVVRCGDPLEGALMSMVGRFTREGMSVHWGWLGEGAPQIGLASGICLDAVLRE